MTSTMLAELSRLFEAESRHTDIRYERLRLTKIASELYTRATKQRRTEIRELLGKTVVR